MTPKPALLFAEGKLWPEDESIRPAAESASRKLKLRDLDLICNLARGRCAPERFAEAYEG